MASSFIRVRHHSIGVEWSSAVVMMPTNEYGYYVAGTRIGLDTLTYDFRRGRSAEAIFEAYPSIGSLAKVYGAITFILEHPAEVDAYLKGQDRIFEEIQTQHPMPAELVERFGRAEERKAGLRTL